MRKIAGPAWARHRVGTSLNGAHAGAVDRLLRRLAAWLDHVALFAAALAAIASVLLARAPDHINQDGFLGLVAGREVATNGLPQHDTLTVMANGARWVDEQWLSQLSMYGLHQLGGLALVTIVEVALTVGAFALAIAAARRLGGSELHVLCVLPLAGFLFIVVAVEIRTQEFAYPLFVAVLWLLAADARRPSHRTLLVFPLLCIWANLHGSVVIGAALTALYGLVCLLPGGAKAPVGRSAAFLLGGPACLLATPYGLAVVGYYQGTLLNPIFKRVIAEWQPITSSTLDAVAFFLMAFGCIWVLGRSRTRLLAFESLTLLVLIVAGITTIRNVAWFALAVMVLLPPIAATAFAERRAAPRRTGPNRLLLGAATTALLVTGVVVAAKPRTWFERGYDQRTLHVVAEAAARDPALRVFADGRFADWLLWHLPELRGRIAYDARLELLSTRQLMALSRLAAVSGVDFHRPVDGYEVLVLESVGYRQATAALLKLHGTQIALDGRQVIVATRRTQP